MLCWKKFWPFMAMRGWALHFWNTALQNHWKHGRTSVLKTHLINQLLLKLPLIVSCSDCLWYSIKPETITFGNRDVSSNKTYHFQKNNFTRRIAEIQLWKKPTGSQTIKLISNRVCMVFHCDMIHLTVGWLRDVFIDSLACMNNSIVSDFVISRWLQSTNFYLYPILLRILGDGRTRTIYQAVKFRHNRFMSYFTYFWKLLPRTEKFLQGRS